MTDLVLSWEVYSKKKKALEIELFEPVRQILFGKEVVLEVGTCSNVRTFVENAEKIFMLRENKLSRGQNELFSR